MAFFMAFCLLKIPQCHSAWHIFFRKRRRELTELKCGGTDPRLGRINELWDKKLTISMRILRIKILEMQKVMGWEFTYQQIEFN